MAHLITPKRNLFTNGIKLLHIHLSMNEQTVLKFSPPPAPFYRARQEMSRTDLYLVIILMDVLKMHRCSGEARNISFMWWCASKFNRASHVTVYR